LVDDMAALGIDACKWPIGDPKATGFTFCGRHTQSVYCVPHAQLAYRPGKAAIQRGPVVRRVLAGLAA
jgi:GcrA cell cycle regulator